MAIPESKGERRPRPTPDGAEGGRPSREREKEPAKKLRRVDKEQMEARVKAGEAFSEMDFRQCDFSKMNLEKANFVRCDFRNASFKNAKLDRADFTLCDMRNADCSKASMHMVVMANGDLKKANFTEADLSEADISDAEIDDAIFFGANLRGILHRGVDLNDGLIKGAKNLPLSYRNKYLHTMNEHPMFFVFMGVIGGIGLVVWLVYSWLASLGMM